MHLRGWGVASVHRRFQSSPMRSHRCMLWQAAGLELGRQLVQERQGREAALTAASQLETALEAVRMAGKSACRV